MNDMIFDDLPFFQQSSEGGDLTVDQTYDSTSTNAQSGTAVAEAVESKASITYVDQQDNNLQQQIDSIASSSDVVDVVGTYAELQAYDTAHLKNNDIVKVLQDETKEDAITYYRWNTSSETWSYVGKLGPYYTKSEFVDFTAQDIDDLWAEVENL